MRPDLDRLDQPANGRRAEVLHPARRPCRRGRPRDRRSSPCPGRPGSRIGRKCRLSSLPGRRSASSAADRSTRLASLPLTTNGAPSTGIPSARFTSFDSSPLLYPIGKTAGISSTFAFSAAFLTRADVLEVAPAASGRGSSSCSRRGRRRCTRPCPPSRPAPRPDPPPCRRAGSSSPRPIADRRPDRRRRTARRERRQQGQREESSPGRHPTLRNCESAAKPAAARVHRTIRHGRFASMGQECDQGVVVDGLDEVVVEARLPGRGGGPRPGRSPRRR